jgi:ABC-type nitrate/sulfonate/bicarbonate transport system permease component
VTPARHAREAPRIGGVLLGTAVFIVALAVWEAWARRAGSFYFRPVSEVAERAWDVWPSAEFLHAVGASLERLAAGYAIGATAAVALGLVLGASPGIRRTLGPTTEFLRALPVIAVVPVAVVLLGVGDAMRIGVIAFGVFFPVLLATVAGVRGLSPEIRDTAALLQVRPLERSVRIHFPAALPSIFAGLRTSLSIGLVLIVISELTGEGDGLGVYILEQKDLFRVREMYAAILFLGLLGYLLNRLFLVLERHALAWHYGAVGAQ